MIVIDSHLTQIVSLVGVEPALHEHDADALEEAEEQPGLVAGHGGLGEEGDLVVREHVGLGQEVRQLR